jgi:hypothetical protein
MFFCCFRNKLTSLEGVSGPLKKDFGIMNYEIKGGIPYSVVLSNSTIKISKKEWDKLDKSSIE